MSSLNGADRSSDQKYRLGFVGVRDYTTSWLPRAASFVPPYSVLIRPHQAIFPYTWEPHPQNPNVLVNPGHCHEDPLRGAFLPKKFEWMLKTRYGGEDAVFWRKIELNKKEAWHSRGPVDDANQCLVYKRACGEPSQQPPGESSGNKPYNRPTTGELLPGRKAFGHNRTIAASRLQTGFLLGDEIVSHRRQAALLQQQRTRKRKATHPEPDLTPENHTASRRSAPVGPRSVRSPRSPRRTRRVPGTTRNDAAAPAHNRGRLVVTALGWARNKMKSLWGVISSASQQVSDLITRRRVPATPANVEVRTFNVENNNVVSKRRRLLGNNDTGPHDHGWISESCRLDVWRTDVGRMHYAMLNAVRCIEYANLPESEKRFGPSQADQYANLDTCQCYTDILKRTADLIAMVYSARFLRQLKNMFWYPGPYVDYNHDASDIINVEHALEFLQNMPKELWPLFHAFRIGPDELEAVADDFSALVNNKPVPSLIPCPAQEIVAPSTLGQQDDVEMGGVTPPRPQNDESQHINSAMPGAFPPAEGPGVSEGEANDDNDDDHGNSQIEQPPAVDPGSTLPLDHETLPIELIQQKLIHPSRVISYGRNTNKSKHRWVEPKNTALRRDSASTAEEKRKKGVRFVPGVKDPTATPEKKLQSFVADDPFYRPYRIDGSPVGIVDSPSVGINSHRLAESPSRRRLFSKKAPQTTGPVAADLPATRLRNIERSEQESDSDSSSQEATPGRLSAVECAAAEARAHISSRVFSRSDAEAANAEPDAALEASARFAQLRINKEKEGEIHDAVADQQLSLEYEEHKKAEEAKLLKTGGLREPRTRMVEALSTDWLERTRLTVRSQSANIVTAKDGTPLGRHDFAKVVPSTEWLNDNIVNGSLQWLEEHVNGQSGGGATSTERKCASLGSFFFQRLQSHGPTGVQRAIRRLGITDKDKFLGLETVLIPICQNMHWTLAVVRPKKRTIAHMDSLNPNGNARYLGLIRDWVKHVCGDSWVDGEWTMTNHEAPLQTNGYDCGVHTITNGMCLALGLNPIDTYRSVDMPRQRLRIAAMLLNRGFSNEFSLSRL